MTKPTQAVTGHADLMDRMYRLQRHFYDLTRKYYLLGRDRMLDEMTVRPGDRVLEIGCGTARNLIESARRRPSVRFYGLDISAAMLETASRKVRREGLADRILLRQCAAESVHYRDTFSLSEPFDVIFFSYSLSMIPTWRESLRVAADNLKPGGRLHVVDFCDQADMPAWFRGALAHWLELFHVAYRPEFLEFLNELSRERNAELRVSFPYRRYAFLAEFHADSSGRNFCETWI